MPLIIFLFSFLLLYAQPSQVPEELDSSVFEIFDISIRNTSQNRRIYIATPKEKHESYRILYVLDGNAQFPMALNIYVRDVLGAQKAEDSPKNNLIIVGLGYNNEFAYDTQRRTWDYLPEVSQATQNERLRFQGGGADEFYKYIKENVVGLLDSEFSITERGFFGHSFGGVFCLHLLFTNRLDFNHYFCASPSMYYGNGSFVPDSRPYLTHYPDSITITAGSLEENRDKSALTAVLREDLEICKKQTESCDNSRINFIIFDGKTHGESLKDSLNMALCVMRDF